jgi:sugar phosphate isomerase/epimerase
MKPNSGSDLGGMTRRDALKATAAGLVAVGFPSAGWLSQKRIPIGLQLYSVRRDCGKDIDASLKQVADMGFEGVEFAGYYKYKSDAKGLKKKLDELGLKAAGTHIGANSFAGDKLKATIEFHQTIGCQFLIVPGDGRFTHPEKSKEFADLMNKAAAELKPLGLFCGYHNHTKEFKKHEDKTYWDLFAERTSKDVILQQDVGWTKTAGLDPAALVRRYPGRTRTTHFKASTSKGAKDLKHFIGQDAVDWKPVITACYEVGGTEWFTVEQEAYPDGKTPMECCRISLENLKKILAEMGKK